MNTLQIVLLIVGIILVIISFIITERLSSSDIDSIKEMSSDEVQRIINSKVETASIQIEDALNEKIADSVEFLERKTDKETNDKIMQISEYSNTVLDAVQKSHNEVMFMYSMLNDKHRNVTELTKNLQNMESEIRRLDQSVAYKMSEMKDDLEAMPQVATQPAVSAFQPVSFAPTQPAFTSFNEDMTKHFQDNVVTRDDRNADNAKILELYDMGLSEVEIAKKLGRGLGEIKFVLGLYQGGR